jgi:hypothetical protein
VVLGLAEMICGRPPRTIEVFSASFS